MVQKDDIFMKMASDSYAYSEYQKKDRPTNTDAFNRAKKALPEVMKLLPKKQRTYIYLYFVEQKNTVEIAKQYHINKATVSRMINRGLDRIYRIMVIISPEFADGLLRKKRHLRCKHQQKSHKKRKETSKW